MFELLEEEQKSSVSDIPITPILDMLVAIIFFLLLSTTFIDLTKQTLPPSQKVTVTDPLKPPPLAPMLLVTHQHSLFEFSLRWGGNRPGQRKTQVQIESPELYSHSLINRVSQLVSNFKESFPQEDSLQVGFAPDVPFQVLVSTMDSVLPYIPDIVLIDYRDTISRTQSH